jgi:hypothetical protein
MRTIRAAARNLALVLAVAGGAVTLTASPAAAAKPICDSSHMIELRSGVYDPAKHKYFFWLFLPMNGTTQSFDCISRQGHPKNAGATTVQQTLNLCYNQRLTIDGIFGPDTFTALKNAQTWAKYVEGHPSLAVDGVYGLQTARAIRWPVHVSPTKASDWTCKSFPDIGR